MTAQPSTTTDLNETRRFDRFVRSKSNGLTVLSLINLSPTRSIQDGGSIPPSRFAKPFDRFKPLGGGAEHDIFRWFKIHKSEEEHFTLHWLHKHSPGLIIRDDDGTLVFRVSSSDSAALATLGIGHADSEPGNGVKWTHVYDEEGVPWISRRRVIDYTASPFRMGLTLAECYALITVQGIGELDVESEST